MFWRKRLPAPLRPALDREERVLAWAPAGPDAAVVATNRGLFLPGRVGRTGWHEIHKATWSRDRLTITPAEVVAERSGYLVVTDGPPVELPLPEPADVPRVVRDRVTASVSYSSHHRLPGGGGARVVARRVSGVDGLSWAVRYDPGTDPDAPGIPEATQELLFGAG